MLRKQKWDESFLEGSPNHSALSPFSLSTFPMRWLRLLRPMKEKAGRTENREASATGFRVGFAQLTTTIRALRAGRS